MVRHGNAIRLFVILLALIALTFRSTASDDDEFFERQVRPLLAGNCWKCHGPDQQKAGLRLDSRDAILKGGDTGPAAVPGDPQESLLVDAVRYGDLYQMPPTGKLTDEQIQVLVEWVRRGAPWPTAARPDPQSTSEPSTRSLDTSWWAFQPRRVVEPPAVRDTHWPQGAIDVFVLAKLEASGLSPAPRLDPAAWLRRVTFDLTGLPPTPAEIAELLADDSQAGRAGAVDRLLASPRYGERWARHWLDLVRFAETAGHEFDFELPEAYRYRDYVIRALNDDVPYDRFVQEHLAGDLLPDPRYDVEDGTNQSLIATGFFFLGESKHSPVDIRADELERTDNQIDVMGKTFLGLTVACARCHDHKFDPIPQDDYYALAGILHSSRFRMAAVDDPRPRKAALDELRGIDAELAEAERDWLRQLMLQLSPSDMVAAVRTPLRTQAGRLFESFTAPGYAGWSIEGEAWAHGPTTFPRVIWSRWSITPREVVISGPGIAHSGRGAPHLEGALRSASFTIEHNKIAYRASGRKGRIQLIVENFQRIQDPIYGGLRLAVDDPQPRWIVQDVSMWRGRRAYIELFDDGPGWLAVDEIRVGDDLSPLAVDWPKPQSPSRDSKWPARFWPNEAWLPELNRRVRAAIDAEAVPPEIVQLLERRDVVASQLHEREKALAIGEGSAADETLLIRGNHKTPGHPVPRRTLSMLADSFESIGPTSSGRWELARNWTDPANPLLARVIVNRLWLHHLGEGLVRSPDNFGKLGEPPTHPELLDWLADDLVRHDWSLKRLHRQIVLSSAYAQSGRIDAQAAATDPKNQLWHHVPPRRLEAEALRDAMLAIAGRLDPTLYGPSVLPHLSEFMQGRGRPANSGPLDGAGRRSVYLNVRRNFLTPLLLAFDYPTPFSTVGRRSRANVPGQALVFWNNPLVRELAFQWARNHLAQELSSNERLTQMYLEAFGRTPNQAEQSAALEYLNAAATETEEDAWTDLAHVLWNTKEFVFVR